ncbi:hypothetical protein ACLK1S_02315 [Escherichia coli]
MGYSKSNYGYGIVAMNSDSSLTITMVTADTVDNGTELDNSSVDNVVAATGNYKVGIDNATGAGAITLIIQR